MKPCPECDGVMEKHTGLVSEPVITGWGKIERRTRLTTFYACTTCEHCEEKDR